MSLNTCALLAYPRKSGRGLPHSKTLSRVTEFFFFWMMGTMALCAGEMTVGNGVGAKADRSLLDYKFTNELGQAVSVSDFHGQALAITFFFTRCPMPDFCPRLSKNFQEASKKLS